jgi:DNA-binding MarR family transcriptional regulator
LTKPRAAARRAPSGQRPGDGRSPGHEIALALRAAYLALHRETDAVLAPWGVTADQFVVIAALGRGEAWTQRELVARTASDPSTLRLEKRELVERRPHPTDGRARRVRLTKRGRRALSRTWSATERVRQGLATALSAGEIERLTTSLGTITTLMNRPSGATGTDPGDPDLATPSRP